METIYLAGGCFWGVEHFFSQFEGIEETEVGYANSIIANPSYEQVVSKSTQATECVKIEYDPNTISLIQILYAYFQIIDPTSLNKQGNDIGTNYRTGIYTTDPKELETIESFVKKAQKFYSKPIVIEVEKLTNFYPAEAYHQDYLLKNPYGYCHISPMMMHDFQLPDTRKILAKLDD